jgi:tetratricopeptide (TPR) repeat protein
MAVGIFVVLAIASLTRSRERPEVATLSVIVAVAAAGGAAMIVIGGSDAARELLDTDLSKFRLLANAMRMLPATWMFGCGRGAFESAFPAFRADSSGYVTFAYPENVAAQWTIEWGLPMGVAGLAALVYALRPSAVLARSTTASGAWAALVALSVQNLGDLGSEIPGLVLAAVVCAGIVAAGAPGHRPRWRLEQWARAPRYVAVAGLAATAVGVALVAWDHGKELHEDQRALYAAAREQFTASDMNTLARAAMLRHPAEPYLPFVAALRASYAHDENPLPWLSATLERAPIFALAHLILARTVARRAPSQARLEYRLAIEQGPNLVDIVVKEASGLAFSYFDAMELVPDGPVGVGVLEGLGGEVRPRLPASGLRLDTELARRAPMNHGPTLRAALAAVEDLEAGGSAPWCQGAAWPACVQSAIALARRAEEGAPRSCLPRALHARARLANGEPKEALKELSDAVDEVGERTECLRTLVWLARTAHDDASVTAAIDRIAKAGCTDGACAGDLAWAAEIEVARENPHRALKLYKQAYELRPDDDALLESVARLTSAVGMHTESAEDYQRLSSRHPAEHRWRDAAVREQVAALEGAITAP